MGALEVGMDVVGELVAIVGGEVVTGAVETELDPVDSVDGALVTVLE